MHLINVSVRLGKYSRISQKALDRKLKKAKSRFVPKETREMVMGKLNVFGGSCEDGATMNCQGGRKGLLTFVLLMALTFGLAANVRAEGITQLEYLQWLAQLSGEAGNFSKNSTPQDFAKWAHDKGMAPSGGWNLNGKLSRDVLGQTLVQFLRLNPGKQTDVFQVLGRHGISLPSGEVSRKHLALLVNNNLQPKQGLFRRKKSPPRPDRDRDQDTDVDRDRDRDNDRSDDRPPPPPRDRDRDGFVIFQIR